MERLCGREQAKNHDPDDSGVHQALLAARYSHRFLSNRSRKNKLNECRKALGIATPEQEINNEKQSRHWYDIVIQLTGNDPTICPVCKKGHMNTYKEIPATSPPLMAAKTA